MAIFRTAGSLSTEKPLPTSTPESFRDHKHDFADGVEIGAPGFGEAFALKLFGIGDIRGEKNVEGPAIFDLREKISGRAQAEADFAAGGLLEIRGDFVHRVCQVGSRRDGDRAARIRSLRRECGARRASGVKRRGQQETSEHE